MLYTHGVVNNAMGCTLKHWCWKGPKGSRQSVPPADRLAAIFSRIQRLYRDLGVSNTLTSLHLKDVIGDVAKPHASKPSLRIKGANCKGLVQVFVALAKELNSGSDTDQHILAMFQGIGTFTDLLDTCPMFPSVAEAEQAIESMAAFLKNFQWLGRNCDDEMLWVMQYKHHTAWHLAQGFRYMNPRWSWCFKGEDLVGKISRLGASVVHGCKATGVSYKLFEKYRFLLHLKLKLHLLG